MSTPQQMQAAWDMIIRIENRLADLKTMVSNMMWVDKYGHLAQHRWAFLIGNGESRQGQSLHVLKRHGLVVGCNALHREFLPDILVAVDGPMMREIKRAKPECLVFFAELGHKQLRPMDNEFIPPIPYPTYASGPSSSLVACCICQQSLERVFLIGHDFWSTTGNINNVYKGTANYRPGTAPPRNASRWLEQHAEIADANPGVTFTLVGNPFPDDRLQPFIGYDNVDRMTYEEFWSLIP